MLYVTTSYMAGKVEKHLVCFQVQPGVFYLLDNLIGVGADFDSEESFFEFIRKKGGSKAIILNGSASQYTVAVPLVDLPHKAVKAINGLIQTLSKSGEECFYFAPCLTKDSLTGMARHYVRASLKKEGIEDATEDEITQATEQSLVSYMESNRRSFLNQRLKMLKGN